MENQMSGVEYMDSPLGLRLARESLDSLEDPKTNREDGNA